MKDFLEALTRINDAINGFVWGPIALTLLIGTGVFFTIKTGFFQLLKPIHIFKSTLGKIFTVSANKRHESGSVTPLQALCTAMAATVGTGNIAGVTGAIILGGPGAIFWMWISAFFGMMTKYAEIVLAIKYREKNSKGELVGGPMYYIKNGMGRGWRWLAIVFSVFGALAAFGIGNIAQVSTVSSTIVDACRVFSPNADANMVCATVGAVMALMIGFVVLGGITRIGKVASAVVPFMSVFYAIGSIIVLFANFSNLGGAFLSIFEGAFNPRAAVGGIAGFTVLNTISRGVGRGVFSNEAGLGSSPIAHAASSEASPVKQGFYGIVEVFLDTIVICTMTALVVLSSGLLGSAGAPFVYGDASLSGATLTGSAFGGVFGEEASAVFLAIAVLFFAGATMLSWQLYGERCFEYITKGRFVRIYKLLFVITIIFGASMDLKLVWSVSDTLNGLMAIPNLIAILALSSTVFKLTKEYKANLKRRRL